MNERKPIGELNGPWSLLLRFALAAFPVVLSGLIAWNAYLHSGLIGLSTWRAAATGQLGKLEYDSHELRREFVLLSERNVAQDNWIAATKSWIEQGPRFTAKDAEALKAEVLKESRDEAAPVWREINLSLKEIVQKLNDLDKRLAVREKQAEMNNETLVPRTAYGNPYSK